MALIKCPECGTEVSDKAVACPRCGYPIASELSAQKSDETIVSTKPASGEIVTETAHEEKKSNIIPVLIVIAIIVLVLVVPAILLLGGGSGISGKFYRYNAVKKALDDDDYFEFSGRKLFYHDRGKMYECEYIKNGDQIEIKLNYPGNPLDETFEYDKEEGTLKTKYDTFMKEISDTQYSSEASVETSEEPEAYEEDDDYEDEYAEEEPTPAETLDETTEVEEEQEEYIPFSPVIAENSPEAEKLDSVLREHFGPYTYGNDDDIIKAIVNVEEYKKKYYDDHTRDYLESDSILMEDVRIAMKDHGITIIGEVDNNMYIYGGSIGVDNTNTQIPGYGYVWEMPTVSEKKVYVSENYVEKDYKEYDISEVMTEFCDHVEEIDNPSYFGIVTSAYTGRQYLTICSNQSIYAIWLYPLKTKGELDYWSISLD